MNSDVDNGVKEDEVTYLHTYKKKWSGSPWEGNPYRGGLLVGFSPLAFFVVIGLFVMCLSKYDQDSQLFIASIVTLIVYFTWVCFRQNHRALKMANQLAKESIDPRSVYQTAFKYWPTRFAMWMAPWLGFYYYLTFKKKLKDTPEHWCPTCGEPIEKDLHFRLPEAHVQENRLESFRFEAFRCLNGHEYVNVEKGERYEFYSSCPKCHSLLLVNTGIEVVRKPSFWRWGLNKASFQCLHCGETFSEMFKIGWLFSEKGDKPHQPSKK